MRLNLTTKKVDVLWNQQTNWIHKQCNKKEFKCTHYTDKQRRFAKIKPGLGIRYCHSWIQMQYARYYENTLVVQLERYPQLLERRNRT